MKRSTVRTLLTLAAAWLVAASAAVSAAPAHVLWAESVAANVAPALNEYGSNPSYVRWAGVGGAPAYENRSQCASFVTSVFKQVYGWTSADLTAWLGSASPTAAGYHQAIVAQNGFIQIANAGDIQPGDILAVEYLEPNAAVTGHVMIADDIARARTSTAPIVDGTVQYELRVIDSSSTGHGAKTDTRMMSDGTWDAGVGTGILRLYVDYNNVVVGYSWSTEKVSTYYGPQSLRHLQIGRLTHS